MQIDPFENYVEFLEIKGSILRTEFEKSAKLLTPENELDPDGAFLQVSGMYSLILSYRVSHIETCFLNCL